MGVYISLFFITDTTICISNVIFVRHFFNIGSVCFHRLWKGKNIPLKIQIKLFQIGTAVQTNILFRKFSAIEIINIEKKTSKELLIKKYILF